MSPKPWAKFEVDFINHPKFSVLPANAICLWLEGKNYCDKHMSDGLIPTHIIKKFRFSGKKSIEALAVSCGQKNETTAYAPLWEPHAVGYKMHDYLEYNDCREAVLARLERAEDKRDEERTRKAEWRAKKADKQVSRSLSHGTVPSPVPVAVPPLSRSMSETVPASVSETGGSVQNTEPPEKAAATPRLAVSKEPNDNGNYRVIERLAIELLSERPFEGEADLVEATKACCASAGIDYGAHPDVESDVVHRACASALIKARFGPRRQGAAR